VTMKGSVPWMCYIGLSAGVWDGYGVCMALRYASLYLLDGGREVPCLVFHYCDLT